MRKIILLLCAVVVPFPIYAQITFGTPLKINDDWKFCIDSIGDYSKTRVSDSKWRSLDLPHDWSIESKMSDELYSCTGFLPGGVGWYRKSLFIPEIERLRKQFLYFCGVYCNSEVWVNGHYLGKRPNGYVSFIYDITPYVNFGKENHIAVKVDHSDQADSRWYTGSGIYRDVYLISSNYVHIKNWGVFIWTDNVNEDKATIKVKTALVNETDSDVELHIEHRLYKKNSSDVSAYGCSLLRVPSGSEASEIVSLEVLSPSLWSVEDPQLYRVETLVSDDAGNYIDGTSTVTGIRTTSFDPDKGFSLNGKNMKMKGVCLHHDAGALGAVVPKCVWKRRLMTLKDIGVNAIRMSHNLQDEVLYDLCDEMGFLVMDEAFDEWEFPKRKWLEGWNVGSKPGFQGYARSFNEWAEKDLVAMVERDKNHPSIVMWSIGNEVDYPNDPYTHPILDYEGINQKTVPGFKKDKPRVERIGVIAEKFVEIVKQIDSSRVVTGAMAGVVMSNHTKYPYVLDVTGYNYTENRYLKDHGTYPERIIFGSENRHEYPLWRAVADNEHIFGQFLWTGIDYLGESGPYPSRGFVCGLLDLGGFVKPRGLFRKTLWSEKPFASLGTVKKGMITPKTLLFDLEAEWNYEIGDSVRVVAFSNCDSLRLMINGKAVMGRPKWQRQSNAYYWDVLYEPGVLKLESWSVDGSYTDAQIQTYGQSHRLTAYADRSVLCGEDDIVHVEIEMQDENGIRVLDCNENIEFKISGPAELLRLENASPIYTGPYVGDSQPMFRGRILAYVKAGGGQGKINILARCPESGKKCKLVLLAK